MLKIFLILTFFTFPLCLQAMISRNGVYKERMLARPRQHSLTSSQSFNQKSITRSIVDSLHLRGTYDTLKQDKKHLSPFHGMACYETGFIKRLYDLYDKSGSNTKTIEMVRQLFHAEDHIVHPTRNKSLPAYSLNQQLLAGIVSALEKRTLGRDDVDKQLVEQWREHHKSICNEEKLTKSKIENILKIIRDSAEECTQGIYLPTTTLTLLSSFGYCKADNKADIWTYLNRLHELVEILEVPQQDSIPSEEDYKLYTIKKFLERGSQALNEHYERLLYSLTQARSNALPQVYESRYGFEDKSPVANCVETAFHNFLNLVLYNTQTKRFDFNLLPTTTKLHPLLHDFYKEQNYETLAVNSRQIGQTFMNMVSGHSFLSYNKGNYELNGTYANFLKLMDYLFGINAKNLQELGNMLSTKDSPIQLDDKGAISIVNKNIDKYYNASLVLTQSHGELYFNTKEAYMGALENSLDVWSMVKADETSAASLALCIPIPERGLRFGGQMYVFPDKRHEKLSEHKHLMHYYLAHNLADHSKKVKVIKMAAKHLHLYPTFKVLIWSLLCTLPDDYHYFKQCYLELVSILSEKLSVYPHLDEVLLSFIEHIKKESWVEDLIKILKSYMADYFSSKIEAYCKRWSHVYEQECATFYESLELNLRNLSVESKSTDAFDRDRIEKNIAFLNALK
jgi:hypothetical protein